MTDPEGAPIYGGVSDPAATSGGPPLFPPQYRAAPIAVCQECLGDCQQEGTDGFWCPACQHMWTFQQVAYFEDGDRDD